MFTLLCGSFWNTPGPICTDVIELIGKREATPVVVMIHSYFLLEQQVDAPNQPPIIRTYHYIQFGEVSSVQKGFLSGILHLELEMVLGLNVFLLSMEFGLQSFDCTCF